MTSLKLLTNVNVEKPIVDYIRSVGFDVAWLTEIDKRMTDESICRTTGVEERVILTNEVLFAEHLEKIPKRFVIVTKQKFRFINLEGQ